MDRWREFCLFLLIVCVLVSCRSTKNVVDNTNWNSNYPFIFVHGLEGWGDYNAINSIYSYWGLQTGSIPNQLENKGFTCASASMAKTGSAWDRACELYAQLSGTVVDYGAAHSSACNHPRFGQDYTGKALVPEWDETHKINLIAHSFGGVTSRVLIQLLVDGSKEEQLATPAGELSPLFTGGHSGRIFALVTICTPHNGVSAMTINDEGIDSGNWGIKLLQKSISPVGDGRVQTDCTGWEMHIDVATEMNSRLTIQNDIYYFSIPASATHRLLNGIYIPNKCITEPLFVEASELIGKYKGITPAGYKINEDWRDNDGIVNVISAKAPFTEPSVPYNSKNIQTGVWNVMPTVTADHLGVVGGLSKKFDTMSFYVPLFEMINEIDVSSFPL